MRGIIFAMLRAALDAQAFVAGLERDRFLADRKSQQAVVMSLMIVGEAAARTIERSPDFVADHPSIPWLALRGLRNRIAQGYFEVDMNIVWETTQTALPDLIATLQDLDEARP